MTRYRSLCQEDVVERLGHDPYPHDSDEGRGLAVGSWTVVGYLEQDDSPMDFWDGDGLGELVEFTNYAQAPREYDKANRSGRLYLMVQKYEHSAVHYSVEDSKEYPDYMWDVTDPAGIFYPCNDVAEEFRKNKYKKGGKKAAMKKLIEDSNSILDEYSKWCNGDVWGYVTFVYDEDGKELDSFVPDSCWGFIGQVYAITELEGAMQSMAEDAEERARLRAEVLGRTLSLGRCG